VDDTPEMIGADDVTKESGLDEPNVPGAPGQDAEPAVPADGTSPDQTGGHTERRPERRARFAT
jgi:hypothetical protein